MKTPEQIVAAVQRAGVIGAGGGGFPTHVKLKASVETVIANGSECEPLLGSDKAMMTERPDLVIEGMQYAMAATGAKEGVIALKRHYKDAIAALMKNLPEDGSIKLHLLENYYPAGDEFLLVYEVAGKVIPEGGIPLHVGIVVNNVITLMQVARAVNGKPVTERAVTVTGEVREPKVVTVPIGTTYSDMIKIAGGLTAPDAVLIDGGPMMGNIVEIWDQGIGKTTSGIIALPSSHFLIRMKKRPVGQIAHLSKAACCQCFRCTDLCPRGLIGHDIYPHMTMRTIDYNTAEPAKYVTSAFLCSQCGICELVACDAMLLSPRKILAAYRKELARRGVKNPHTRRGMKPSPAFEYRKVAVPTVMKKIDVMNYHRPLRNDGMKEAERVRIPLNRHTGAPAVPTVVKGQKVKMCDVVAETPKDKLGCAYHASIAGKVTDVTEYWVEIRSV